MKTMIVLFTLFLGLFSNPLFAYREGHLEISDSHKVYYRYHEADAGKPTMVMMNGLIYAIENWDTYLGQLENRGIGYVLTAFSTQPESLALLDKTPYFAELEFTKNGWNQVGLESQTLVDETMAVVDSLGINRFNLMSLSYGSIIATRLALQQKHRIDSLIYMSPAIMPSNRYYPLGEARFQYYYNLKQSSTGSFVDVDYLYDVEYYQTLSTVVSPLQHSFDDVSFQDFFHGVYHMVRSAKWFDLKDYATASFPPTHFFLASKEEENLFEDQLRLWKLMENNPARKSLVLFEGGFHGLVGASPVISADMVEKVLNNELSDGLHKVNANY
jgi:pimeloyl-ACP methyl ester carboxylesterase